MRKSNRPEPRIYVACLASYNAGKLHGEWIDATETVEDVREQVQGMLDESPERGAEEFAIHDYEGFESVKISEYASLDKVVEMAQFIEEHGRVGAQVLAYVGELSEARELLGDRYAGEFDNPASFAEHLLDEQGALEAIPENILRYFDFEAFARDLELGGEVAYFQSDQHTHVFWTS